VREHGSFLLIETPILLRGQGQTKDMARAVNYILRTFTRIAFASESVLASPSNVKIAVVFREIVFKVGY
jgi:hypothetical protein